MFKLSKKKLERMAVEAVISEANKPNSLLVANIPVGDKGISFDGEIEVFKDDSESVESLIGKVPVQVKGTQVSEFTQGNRTFPIRLDHLRNYYNSQGVVLFVVEIKASGEKKIFYKQLLPTELREIIKKYGEEKKQKQRTIELRPLSETTLDAVCRKFLRESKKQPLLLIEHNPFKKDEFTFFELTSLTFNPNKPETSNIFEHDFTIYGIKETLTVPLERGRVHSITIKNRKGKFYTNGQEYEFNIRITFEQNRTIIIVIEDSLELEFIPIYNKFNFRIVKFKSLSTQLKIVPFIMDFLSDTSIEFKINTHSIKYEYKLQNSNVIIKDFQKLHSTLIKLKSIFEVLKVPLETSIEQEDGNLNKLMDQINSFVEMFLENKCHNLQINEPEKAKFTLFKLGSLELVLFYNPDSVPILSNAFSEEFILKDTRIVVGDNTYPHSPYIMLTDSALARGANVNLEIIKKSFESFNPFSNEITASVTNEFCLKCINAYDLSKNKQFLYLAEHIYKSYEGENLDPNVILINQAQIKLRDNGSLTDDDIEKLIKSKQSDPENIELQFCASVLLESKHEAKMYFNQLDADRQNYYKKLPIYTLFTKILEDELQCI